ncbi:MAG: hypothetical protein V1904_10460 [Bacteroidota bacterium]
MKKTKIPSEVQEKVNAIIADFNKATFKKNTEIAYYSEFKGEFLYLKRMEGEIDSPCARLRYNGKFNEWDFDIFKWSSERYDPDEFMFPGAEFVNGTIEGALKACQAAYPPSWSPSASDFSTFLKIFSGK